MASGSGTAGSQSSVGESEGQSGPGAVDPRMGQYLYSNLFLLYFCINSILHGIFLFYFIYAHRIPEWLFLENAVSRIPVCVSPSFRPRVRAF